MNSVQMQSENFKMQSEKHLSHFDFCDLQFSFLILHLY